MIKQITKLAKSYWDMDIKPFLNAFFPENKVQIRDEEEPLGYIEDHINEAQPTRLPPEPFATIGATVYLNWQEWRAGLEK